MIIVYNSTAGTNQTYYTKTKLEYKNTNKISFYIFLFLSPILGNIDIVEVVNVTIDNSQTFNIPQQ